MKTQAIYELIGSHVNRAPNALALAAPGRTPLSYVELASQVRTIGRALHGLGVGRNDCVAVVLPHGPECVAASLGVAAYASAVPLDPRGTAQSIQYAFSYTKPKAIFLERGALSAALDIAYSTGIAVVEVEFDIAVAGRMEIATAMSETSAVPLPATANDDAFVVPIWEADQRFALSAINHHDLCVLAHEVVDILHLTDRDRCLNLTPLWNWRGSTVDVIATLAAGGTVVCPPCFDCAFEFFAWVRECRPTWYTAQPAIHEAILAMASANRDVLKHCAIRFVRSSEPELSHAVHAGLENTFKAPVIGRTLGVKR